MWSFAHTYYMYGSPAGEVSLTAGKPSSAKAKTRLIACGTTGCTLCSFLPFLFLLFPCRYTTYVVCCVSNNWLCSSRRTEMARVSFRRGEVARTGTLHAGLVEKTEPSWALLGCRAGLGCLGCLGCSGTSWHVLASSGS